jgi:glutathione S-transferase
VPRVLVHRGDCTECGKVRSALALEKPAWETVEIDAADRDTARKLSRQERLPVLVEDDGAALHDADVILRRLAARAGSRLLPEGRRDQALTWVLVERADALLGPMVDSVVCRCDAHGHPLREDDLRVLERRLEAELAVIEGLLERGPYVFGERPTVVDVCLHAYLARLPRQARPLPSSYLRLTSWYKRLEKAVSGT